MGLKVEGVDSLIATLSQVGERAVRGVSDEIKKGAHEIKDRTVEYAPVDEGNLEEAIKVEMDRSGVNGRIQAYVYVDGSMPVGNGKTVDDYAHLMHEGVYELGPKSKAKDGDQGKVGRKYMERAVDELEESIIKRVTDRLKRIFK